MEERDFFDEKPEQRTHTMTCPHCGQPGEYQIGWLVRRKKAQLRGNADERDRARFAKAQSYMVRTDDVLGLQEHPLPQALRRRRHPVRRVYLKPHRAVVSTEAQRSGEIGVRPSLTSTNTPRCDLIPEAAAQETTPPWPTRSSQSRNAT